ncbi:MAG: hypothetical protein E6G67_05490 [Actinobacteria bacterium]|nr:MAG: hypothetical protein E6G67_05490 [Actinomycetota bacterium]
MADLHRHAAGQPIYEVRELLEGEPAVNLGVRYECSDFLRAVDFAVEYRDANDPSRSGAVSALEIVKVCDGRSEQVWEYSSTRSRAAETDLVGLWGFDVTRTWSLPPSAALTKKSVPV